MPISLEERYKLVYAHHKFVSEYRFKLFAGWLAIYAALAVAFGWLQVASKPSSWVVPALGIGATILMWSTDKRHRHAIGGIRDVGERIETDPNAEIPENQRFFVHLRTSFTHSNAIDVFAVFVTVLLALAIWLLVCTRGALPQ